VTTHDRPFLEVEQPGELASNPRIRVIFEGPNSTIFAPCVDGDTKRGRACAGMGGIKILNDAFAFGFAPCFAAWR
jgi:hypothetical protein